MDMENVRSNMTRRRTTRRDGGDAETEDGSAPRSRAGPDIGAEVPGLWDAILVEGGATATRTPPSSLNEDRRRQAGRRVVDVGGVAAAAAT